MAKTIRDLPMMQRLSALALLCLIVCSLILGCGTAASPRANVAAVPETTAGRAAVGNYKIQPGDLLLVSFSGEPDYNQQVRVDWSGRINLPYLTARGLSELQASGSSTSELAERITEYARHSDVLLHPRVQVLVTEYSNQTFVILGQVNLPGRYGFPRGLAPRIDLEDAIGMAAGYTRLARQSLILIKRGPHIYRVDLRKLTTHPGEPRFIVVPGDVITVTERIF